ncbi:tonb family protein [Paramagnetospirillum caucaseum]|uniref:Tonb family protein n=1 Tax=Paramagnetospirillum caucaseum TaxID=1244869 RepID=M3A9P7_9PROT|nr:energy transducer TonB [Paramagnetospirillum caucaseum]EME69503.1 tonb family protein [Paramagnetospirillum caucaseum]
MSVLLHGVAVVLLIAVQAVPRPDEMPETLPVEIILEVPSPSVPADVPPAPAVSPPAPAKPAAREALPSKPRSVQVAMPAMPSVVSAVAPPEPGATAAPAAPPVQAASPVAAAVPVDYGAYVGILHERIARHRVYPPQAMRRREEGDVRLRILLAGDGSLVDILSLAEASAQLTQAARRAIESAAPFDPPPRGGGGELRLAFDVTVAFRLR